MTVGGPLAAPVAGFCLPLSGPSNHPMRSGVRNYWDGKRCCRKGGRMSVLAQHRHAGMCAHDLRSAHERDRFVRPAPSETGARSPTAVVAGPAGAATELWGHDRP